MKSAALCMVRARPSRPRSGPLTGFVAFDNYSALLSFILSVRARDAAEARDMCGNVLGIIDNHRLMPSEMDLLESSHPFQMPTSLMATGSLGPMGQIDGAKGVARDVSAVPETYT